MTEETTPTSINFLLAFYESLLVVDDFGCSHYQNHLPRWVYLAIPVGAILEAWFMLAAWMQDRDPSAAETEALL